ncbi:hypothetical protein IAQ61_006970 [Plenodomus lingam]|uniref:Predicted protein n=1 Tax=Leptosphaeria maculans (strain JN3 / isolate v23.1.3 / race Av1-4-5-6-7-8) TaxID=985895 RepID=E5AD34_LEPMJ|nr:predicted protein [Plenodomus lingam JN3]KAH9869757.1 hypothetical protein IAQ61_006970 [Plenodomus lingam]CBY02386.1 predicted protein [Plenodomus lingam JN3]
MFVTPVLVARNVLDPSIYGSNRGSRARIDLEARQSVSSTDTSYSNLHRASSTSSTISTSTVASSVGSINLNERPKHRKHFSSSSFGISRRFLKKSRPQSQSEQAPTSAPLAISSPIIPPQPVADPLPEPKSTVEWQCSDLMVRCRSDVYHVDRSIMSYHSRWFAKVCAVVITPKTSKGVIDLSADDPSAVAAMMQYCYQLDYSDQLAGCDTAVPEDTTLCSHVDVYMLAERYGIVGLRRLALQKYEDLATMVLMVDGNEEQLQQAIRAMYASERLADADELKQLSVKLCADHVQSFIHGTGKTMAMVFESMDELPDFRADLFEEMARRWR